MRGLLNLLKLDLTKNLEYDRLTKEVINKVVKQNSICVDVGCHKGEILELILKNAPRAQHYAFEPIPYYYEKLKKKYGNKCIILNYALSDKEGVSEFQFVKNAPAFSGIRKRKYNVETPEIETIQVELKKLDNVIPGNIKIDLIKIDVEGAEFQVMKGAEYILIKNKPVIIFECGIGASDYYDTIPEDVFDFLYTSGFHISLLKDFINNKSFLNKSQFIEVYNKNKEYYFVAFPVN